VLGVAGGGVVGVLRLVHRVEGAGHVVDLALEGAGARQTAVARFGLGLSAQDREDVRWYLEDYLQYPVDPAPQVARRVEGRLAEFGGELFDAVFGASRDTIRLWDAVAGSLAETRVEVAAGAEGAAGVPWELLRDPSTDGVLALRAGVFVRAHPEAAVPAGLPAGAGGALRVLLVICRPGGRADVPFRSVASHLVRLSRKGSISLTAPLLSGRGRQRGLRVVGHGAVDHVGEASLEAAHGFFAGLASGSFALVVVPAWGRSLDLGHGHDVQRVVQLPVAGTRQAMSLDVSG
jgi:hypothetical protein